MEILNITRDAAIKAYGGASKESKTLLENLLGKKNLQINPMERVGSIDDIILESGYKSTAEFYNKYSSVPEHLVSEIIIEMLAVLLNDGWEPDWDNENQYKYFPRFIMSSSGFRFVGCEVWGSSSSVGSRHAFKDVPTCRYAGETFPELFKSYMTIKK